MSASATPLALPPGVDQSRFGAFLSSARDVVGVQNVAIVTSETQQLEHTYMDPAKSHDMYHILDKDYFIASSIISPRKVPEVQAIMKLCNEYKIPVWPFSIGRNVGYGGAAPRVPGSVGLDLGRNMNRILEVSEKNAYCLVEPGVTYYDLYQHLVEKNLHEKLWIDTPDLGGGSVLGNCMERGIGYTPYGDHFSVSIHVYRCGTRSRGDRFHRLHCGRPETGRH